MTLAQTEKLTNFVNRIIIRTNHETGGYYSYFGYKEKQYYASIAFLKAIGPEIAIFPACDDYVTSWDAIYCKHPLEVDKKVLREHIFKFLESIHDNIQIKHRIKK